MFKKIPLDRIQNSFIHLTNRYMKEHDLSQKELAKIVKIPASCLSQYMTKNRKISAQTIYPFLIKEVFLVNEIYDNKPDSKREEEFWAIASLRQKKGLLRAILDVQEIGDDPETILRSWVAAKMSTKKDQ